MEESRRKREVAVVGAGPVGCLAALSFAKLGFKVSVYESRPGVFLRNAHPFPPMLSYLLSQ